jgi:hypothetical protein
VHPLNPLVVQARQLQSIIRDGKCAEVKEGFMLWTIFVLLLALWLIGVVSSYTLGGLLHILLVAAVVILIISLIQGRRAL